jgi:hypothetical protein
MSDFHTVLKDCVKYKDNNACSPIAVALVTGKPFKTAQRWLDKQGRKRGRGTPRSMTHQALKDNGYTLRRLEKLEKECRTVRTLERRIGKRRTLLVHTRRHVLAVVDGKVQDWTKGRLHRIQEIYLVEKA